LHDDRRVALSAIVNWTRAGLKTEAPALRKLIGEDSALRKELNSYLKAPKMSPEVRQMNRELAKHEAERKARRLCDEQSWREFRDKLQANPAELSDPSKVAGGPGFPRLHNLSEWLHCKTRQEHAAAVREWRLLEPAFSKEIAEAYRDGMKALWRVSAPEKPVRQPGGPITVKWITFIPMPPLDSKRPKTRVSPKRCRTATSAERSSMSAYRSKATPIGSMA
jgi:hypothetical protein